MSNYRQVKKAISSGFSYSLDKARELVRRKRILRLVHGNRYIFIVLGFSGDYVAIPGIFCSCKDYELNVVLRGNRPSCYHLLAIDIALRENAVRDVHVDDINLFRSIIYECIYSGRSEILRKILMK